MSWIAAIFRWLELLGFVILLGGMLALGAVAAPVVFNQLPPLGAGGEVMSRIFVRFNTVVAYIAIFLIVLGFAGRWALTRGGRAAGEQYRGIPTMIEAVGVLTLLILVVWAGTMTPRMEALRQERIKGNTAAAEVFEAYHRRAQGIAGGQLVVGLVALFAHAFETARRERL